MFNDLTQLTMADPQYGGPLENYTHFGAAGVPGDGPYMQMWLQVNPPHILRAAYKSNGCPSSMAAGSMAARVITGLTIEKASLLTSEDLLLIMGGLPEGKEACAERAIAAIHAALRDVRPLQEKEQNKMPDPGGPYRYTNSSGPSSCQNGNGDGGSGCGFCCGGTYGSLPSGGPPSPDGTGPSNYLGGSPVILVGEPSENFCPGAHLVP